MSGKYQRIGEDLENTPLFGSGQSRGSRRSFLPQVAVVVLVAVSILGYVFHGREATKIAVMEQPSHAEVESAKGSRASEKFDLEGRYIMRNFDQAKPMSNFLAGLGGLWGVPLWTFYVNRGQGIAAFGLQNKDGAIMKFNTAEKAYQTTPYTGFRTFVKGYRKHSSFTSMPFFPASASETHRPLRNMMIGQNEMEVEEVDTQFGLQTNVLYYTIAEEEFTGLIRRTTFTNLDRREELTLEVLDGLGKLVPAGLNNGVLDAMGRTMEGNQYS